MREQPFSVILICRKRLGYSQLQIEIYRRIARWIL
nr:MAG TPA: hypothetical protein [Caudoviricetes sp.]